jgi:cystathionine beta-lyase/cystathionine gamma-synthase
MARREEAAMAGSRYRKDRIGEHRLHPETLMLGYGYDPALSEGAVKQPVFLTSTFVFRTAEEGRDFFDFTAGRREPDPTAAVGLVYSRFNHPNSEIVARFLAGHPRVARVYYPALLPEDSAEGRVFRAQCEAAGTTFSFDLAGDQAEAFRLLNALQVFKLAVSLGGTESLVCHPATTVHSGVPKATRERLRITDATIRLSIGIEHADDLVADLAQALATSST